MEQLNLIQVSASVRTKLLLEIPIGTKFVGEVSPTCNGEGKFQILSCQNLSTDPDVHYAECAIVCYPMDAIPENLKSVPSECKAYLGSTTDPMYNITYAVFLLNCARYPLKCYQGSHPADSSITSKYRLYTIVEV